MYTHHLHSSKVNTHGYTTESNVPLRLRAVRVSHGRARLVVEVGCKLFANYINSSGIALHSLRLGAANDHLLMDIRDQAALPLLYNESSRQPSLFFALWSATPPLTAPLHKLSRWISVVLLLLILHLFERRHGPRSTRLRLSALSLAAPLDAFVHLLGFFPRLFC